MSNAITITVADQAVLSMLARLQQHYANPQPMLEDIALTLESKIYQRFELKEDPNGSPWAEWANATRQQHEKQDRGSLLEMYGRMIDSLNSAADDTHAVVGFNVPYAVHHEFGARDGKLPRRGMLLGDPVAHTLGDEDREAVLQVMRDYMQAAIA